MNAEKFVKALAEISLPDVFNPYADHCSIHDLPEASKVRCANLIGYLNAIENSRTDVVWMGRDLGYRGGRRTGLALTDESHLSDMSQCYPGSAPERATLGPMIAERTATEIWTAIRSVPIPPLLWNVFPFHPHENNQPLSNRKFTSEELSRVNELNQNLIAWLGIRRIVCIGQDASKYALSFGVDVDCIRHPSYGGVSDFRAGVRRIYNLPESFTVGAQKDLF